MKRFIAGLVLGSIGLACYQERRYLKKSLRYGLARAESGQKPDVKEIWEDINHIWDAEHPK